MHNGYTSGKSRGLCVLLSPASDPPSGKCCGRTVEYSDPAAGRRDVLASTVVSFCSISHPSGRFNASKSLTFHIPLYSITTRSGELKNGIEDLLNKECSSLILESDTDELSVWDHSVIRCGTLEIYPKSRKVEQNGTEISLTPKEFDILLFLARNRGEVFTKEQIYQAVWDGEYLMDDSNIMAFIRKIRKKIEPNPDAPEYIVTIWGIGYKFSDRL